MPTAPMNKDTIYPHDTHSAIPYRPGVGIMLLNKKREVFVGQRLDQTSEAWQMPQGGIQREENPLDAVFRELKEETGITNATVLHESADWFFYDFPNELAAKLWRGRYRGQRQKWFALEFTGASEEINIATENPEFCEWKWVHHKDVPKLIVPFKRKLYEVLLQEEFAHLFR